MLLRRLDTSRLSRGWLCKRCGGGPAPAVGADSIVMLQHIRATTFHKRKGAVRNHFSYGVDYILIDPDAMGRPPRFFSRNRNNMMSFWTHHHGGLRGAG